MEGSRRRLVTSTMMAGAALVGLAAPSAAQEPEEAQVAQAETAAPQVDAERLKAYATIHVETAETAREFYAELARTFESQRKATIREEMDAALAAIREKHGMTPEEYKRITYVISVDQASREAFEALVEEAGGAPPPL